MAIRATGNNVALAGILIDAGHLLLTNIRDNSISAQFGILGVGDDKDPLFLSNFRCERNYLICLDTGIQLSGANQKSSVGSVFHDNIVIADNFVSGSLSGIVATGSAGTGPTHIIANAILLREDKGVSGDGIVVGIVESTQSGSLASGQIRIRDNGILKGNNGIRLVKQPFPLGPIILSGNRLEGLSENGIWIESAALLSSALIENNFLNMIGGNGILMDVKSVARSLKVLGNELTNIAASTARSKDTAEVAAINLSTVFEVAVSDNLIQDVGTNSPYAKTITGVRVIQCENIQISGNTIANIAPSSRFYELAAGIHVKSGAHNVEINGNLIRRQVDTETTTDNSQWQAVRVAGGSIEESKTAAMQAGIHGNSFYGYGNIPMVEVSVSGACQFSDNYCSLLGGSAGIEVDLTGASIIASANRVECSSEIIPLNLKTVNAKTTNPFAVVANIANGQIQVNGNPLDAPWNHLNVII